ncbi:hypothetical protein RD792_002108 [Penstemon davidsonii]|uniref:Uncharacterized protein n=1 Tax=Penstemon davidsonii TaxID=160366 RepID=A0ABR0DQJ1_9LAMI|nr:hypothetical protein RD792_002108 [Penstemon davidsonii]
MTTLLSTSLWTFYGVLKPGGFLVVTVNVAGAALHIVYVILFLIYAPNNTKVRLVKLVGAVNIVFLGAVILVTLVALENNKSSRITFVGFVCAGLTIGMYAAPLSSMVPNGIGFLLASAQLILYMTYRNKSNIPEKLEEKMEEEEGSAHLFKMQHLVEIPSLNKGHSLPKTSVVPQYNHNIIKTLSLTSYQPEMLS